MRKRLRAVRMSSPLKCSRCGKALKRAAVESGDLKLGRVCAERLRLAAGGKRAEKQRARRAEEVRLTREFLARQMALPLEAAQ